MKMHCFTPPAPVTACRSGAVFATHSNKRVHIGRHVSSARARVRRSVPVGCTSAPPPLPPRQLRGLEGTGPLYALLAGAQAIPFLFTPSGVVGDISYFSITAVSALILGCKRATMDESGFEKALVSRKAALAAPFLASGVLLTCYLVLKYTDIDISLILNCLTSLSAAVFLKESCDPLFVELFKKLGIENQRGGERDSEKPAPSEWVTGTIAVAVTAGYLTTKSFVLSNMLALGIVARVLGLVRLESFTVAGALLGGLLLYDVWWVFGSTLVFEDNVMVSTAYLDSPGKLLFPRQAIDGVVRAPGEFQYAVLGLGDLFVPGLFLALTTALDAYLREQGGDSESSGYFNTAIVCYAVGLLTCFAANSLTSAPQPALLYIVPALFGGTLFNALRRGELSTLLSFRFNLDDEPVRDKDTS